jgi:hypothetical protein
MFICFFVLASAIPAFAINGDVKVSQHGGGHQIWFQAEYFDERSLNILMSEAQTKTINWAKPRKR